MTPYAIIFNYLTTSQNFKTRSILQINKRKYSISCFLLKLNLYFVLFLSEYTCKQSKIFQNIYSSTFFHSKYFLCLIAWSGYRMNLQLTVPHDNVEIIRQIHMMCFLLVHIQLDAIHQPVINWVKLPFDFDGLYSSPLSLQSTSILDNLRLTESQFQRRACFHHP